jgi:MFS family permease
MPEHQPSRIAIALVFFANGAGMASWVPHIPMVQMALGLSPSRLGMALLATAAGALVGIPISGRVSARLGSRTVVRASALLFFGVLALPIVAPSFSWLVAALFALGAGNGAIDVSMNAQASALETRVGRPIMSSFHALWSVGGLVGAGLAAAALHVGLSSLAHVLGATALFATLMALGCLRLLPPDADVQQARSHATRPTGILAALGAIAFLALLTEGAVGDWSAVYLQHSLGADASTAALGFAAFSFTMAMGRFFGDALARRWSDQVLLRTSSAVGAIGLGLALAIGTPAVGIVGFACVGVGVANLIPVVFRTAGNLPGFAASESIAAVGTAGYVGLLAGPPLIGFAAEGLTLAGALGLLVAALGWIAVAAGRPYR